MTHYTSIYDFIQQNETAYSLPIDINGWEWNMQEHIKTSFFYKHSQFLGGKTQEKPFKNIVRPILNLQYRAEDIDVKDIQIYVDDTEKFHLSFLVKKYHDEVFVKENDLDTFFDEAKEEKVDLGGTLVQKIEGARPEKVSLQSLAFCDQTDILAGPFAIKLFFSPDELKAMESRGWGNKANGATATVDDVIMLSENQKTQPDKNKKQSKTPGKYIEVYQVYGTLPASFLNTTEEKYGEDEYVKQIQFCTFYKKDNGDKEWMTLFRKRDTSERFKFFSRDKIYGRALGFGGIEELFDAQRWTNYSMIHKKQMLDAASKTILKTTDAAFAARNKIQDMENLEIAVIEEGKDIGQVDTFPRNAVLFDKWGNEWEEHAQRIGSATDPLLGETPPSGTPFRLQERVVLEGKGIHEYRRGKYAKFIEEVYQDWIIPYISEQIVKGTKFLAELSQDEMQYVADSLVRSKANQYVVEQILGGKNPNDADVEAYKERIRDEFMRGGNKKFIEILKDEMKGVTLKVKVNVAGKQKDLAMITDKLTNIFRQIFANPVILDDPRMMKIFNKILQYSGFDPIDFGSAATYKRPEPQMLPQPASQMKQPLPATA